MRNYVAPIFGESKDKFEGMLDPEDLGTCISDLKVSLNEETISDVIIDIFSKYDVIDRFDKNQQDLILKGYFDLLKLMNKYYKDRKEILPSYGKFFMHFIQIVKYLEQKNRLKEIENFKDILENACIIIEEFCEYNAGKHLEQLVIAKGIKIKILDKLSKKEKQKDERAA
jgi:hypothetical protein